MATTRESIEDGFRWTLKILKIGLKRAFIIGALAGLFAIAVVVSTRETTTDCGDVTAAQRSRLTSLLDTTPARSFHASGPAACVDGEYAAPVVGMRDSMEDVSAELAEDGWVVETNYIGYYRQLWRRCFTTSSPGWEGIQILVDASRGGTVTSVRATAPENAAACELERRDESTIFPP